jgi:hypothetical protein
MAIKIFFRGAALFVAQGGGPVTDVLFPSAEHRVPPEGKTKEFEDDSEVVARVMKHADGTPAVRHYAGALILGPGPTTTYRKLADRLVQASPTGNGAKPSGGLLDKIPPIAKATKKTALELRDLSDPTNFEFISTRFRIHAGEMSPDSPSGLDWALDGGKHGDKVLLPNCPLAVAWTFPASVTEVRFEINDLKGSPTGEAPIVLNEDQPTAFFYHFDNALPTKPELTTENPPQKKNAIDHDFKWLYELFRPVTGEKWKDWLGTGKFPAPQCTTLVPVSTCFPGLWE